MKKLAQIILTVLFSLCLIGGTVATVSAAAVGKVKNLEAITAPTTVTLKWTAPSGAKGYEVQQYISKKWKTVKKISKAKTTSVKITKLKSKKTYKFRVRAKGKKGYGAYVTISVKTVPPTVKDVKVTPSLETASVKWAKAEGVKGYKVEYSTSKKFTKKTTKTTTVKKGSTVKATLKKLSPGKTYYVRVRSYTSLNGTTHYGEYSKVVKFKTAYTAKVTGLKTKSTTYDSATISWKKVSGTSGYQIERKSGKKWVSVKSNVSKSSTSYTIKKLSAVTKYEFRVRAYKKISGKVYAGPWATVASTTAVGTPTKLAYNSLTTTSVKLTWTAGVGAKGYYVKNNGKTISTVSTNSATLKINPGTSYKITVVAYNGKNQSVASSAISFTSPCAQVTGLKSTTAETSVTYSWTKATGATSYEVQYRKNGGSWSAVASTTSTSYTVNALEPNMVYQFQVRALNKNGSAIQRGAYSAVASATTRGISAVVNGSDMNLSWTAIPGASKYTVQKYNESTSSWNDVTTISGTSYTAGGSEAANYRIIAKNSGGTVLYTSEKFALRGSGATIVQDGHNITVKWSGVSGAIGYQVRRSTSQDWIDTDYFNSSTFKADYFIAPGLAHNFKVYAILHTGDKLLCDVNVLAPAINVAGTSAEAKNAQLHYLAEAINRTKFDNSKNLKIDISGTQVNEITYISLGGSAVPLVSLFLLPSGYALKNGELVWDTPERIDKFVNYMNSEEGEGAESVERVTTSTLKREYNKPAGNALGTLTDEGADEHYLPAEQVFEPMASGKYIAEIYNGTDSAAVAKAFDVTTTKTANGYKIVATIKQEKTPYNHRGLVSGIVDNVADLSEAEDALNSTITVGNTVLVAEIDNNCQLTSYTISSPYSATAGLEADNIETEKDGPISISFVTKFTGKVDYSYKFTRS